MRMPRAGNPKPPVNVPLPKAQYTRVRRLGMSLSAA